ncbi:UNVERIFIED_CONTAM: hypothetical protein NCL1_20689 [Trichonephila clavipes]
MCPMIVFFGRVEKFKKNEIENHNLIHRISWSPYRSHCFKKVAEIFVNNSKCKTYLAERDELTFLQKSFQQQQNFGEGLTWDN